MVHIPVKIQSNCTDALPAKDQQPLAGLHSIVITTGSVITFPVQETDFLLVIASAFDKRQDCNFILKSPDGSWKYFLYADYCSIGQRFHITIPSGYHTIEVEALEEDQHLWLLSDPDRLPCSVPAIWPKGSENLRLKHFSDRLQSDCLAEFGWMGGCILQAFEALARTGDQPIWDQAIDTWLSYFMDDQHLSYQGPSGRHLVDEFVTIETTLPIATVVKRQPNHPIVDITIQFLKDHASRDATCEGCYTVALPLLQIGISKNDVSLQAMALEQLNHRRALLYHEGHIYLRHHGQHRTYRNWARGVGWYLLGYSECLRLAGTKGEWSSSAEHLTERANWALKHQRSDGLWSNFFYEPELPADTAGSAGIAAALITTHELGLIGPEGLAAAERCWEALLKHLHADGWLGGTSASNKRQEPIQHFPYRTSETFGMGLMGLLAGRLGKLK